MHTELLQSYAKWHLPCMGIPGMSCPEFGNSSPIQETGQHTHTRTRTRTHTHTHTHMNAYIHL